MSHAAEPGGFEKFRRIVFDDPTLQEQLSGLADQAAFITRAVDLGRERGCAFLPADVEAALQAARRSWIERWIA